MILQIQLVILKDLNLTIDIDFLLATDRSAFALVLEEETLEIDTNGAHCLDKFGRMFTCISLFQQIDLVGNK